MGQNKDLFVTGKSSHSGSVTEDSGNECKSPVLDLKGGLCEFRKKSENFNSLRQMRFRDKAKMKKK